MSDLDYTWIPRMRDTFAARLRRYEAQVDQRHPTLIRTLAQTEQQWRQGIPSWCPLPIGAVINEGVDPGYASAVTAVHAWRAAGRHIAYVHPSRLPPPVTQIPLDALKQLPVHCLYLATTDADGVPASGLFAWLEYDQREDRTEVRLQLDLPGTRTVWDTQPDPVHVVRGNLRDAVSATVTTAASRMTATLGQPMPLVGKGTPADELLDRKADHTGHLLAALAFLANPAAEVIDARTATAEPGVQQWSAPLDAGTRDTVTLWLAA